MVDSQAAVEVMVEVMVEFHLHTAHLKSHLNMAHPDIAQDVLLELNSDMYNRDTKLPST